MEALAFYVVLLGFSIIDIVTMTKKDLKKEIVPYVLIALIAGALGLFLFDPEKTSIARLINNLLGAGG